MGIAMATEGFFAPFHGLVQGLSNGLNQLLAPRRVPRAAQRPPSQCATPAQRTADQAAPAPASQSAIDSIAARAIPVRPAGQFGLKKAPALPSRRPLRVVRVFEGPQAPAVAGRMVISGRLADVCAELDRLAAQEKRGEI
jgi:hypothetical protein